MLLMRAFALIFYWFIQKIKKEKEMSQNKKLILDAKDRPSTGKWIALSFQHVFAQESRGLGDVYKRQR